MPRSNRYTLRINIALPLRARSRIKVLCESRRNERFRFLDICFSEEELSVQVGQVNGIEVDDLDVAESDEDEILEEFATDPAGADNEDLAFADATVSVFAEEGSCVGVSVAGHGEMREMRKVKAGMKQMKHDEARRR